MAYRPKKDIEMAAKRHKAEEIVTKLRQVDVLNAQGKSMAEAIRIRWLKGRSGEALERVGGRECSSPACSFRSAP